MGIMNRIVSIFMISVLSVSILFFFISPQKASACSCAATSSPTEERDKSAAVFSGKVVKLVDKNQFELTTSTADPINVLFEVDKTWKGIDQTNVMIKTSRSEASCGYEFQVGKEYLVYVSTIEKENEISLCSATKPLSTASNDLIELGKGEEPSQQVTLSKEETKQKPILMYTGISVGLIVLILFFIYFSKRKRSLR